MKTKIPKPNFADWFLVAAVWLIFAFIGLAELIKRKKE